MCGMEEEDDVHVLMMPLLDPSPLVFFFFPFSYPFLIPCASAMKPRRWNSERKQRTKER